MTGGCNILISIDGKDYYAHRVAHLLMNGEWPERNPEHYDLVPFNNTWVNICDVATDHENKGNRRTQANNTSGLKGVFWHVREQKWGSQIKVHRKIIHLGYFDNLRLAGLIYDAAAKLVWSPRFQKLNFTQWESKDIILPPRVLIQIGEALEREIEKTPATESFAA